MEGSSLSFVNFVRDRILIFFAIYGVFSACFFLHKEMTTFLKLLAFHFSVAIVCREAVQFPRQTVLSSTSFSWPAHRIEYTQP